MSARGDYSEDGMIQKDAAAILGELGWSSIHAQAETEDRPHLTGRSNFTETVLTPDLRAALERLNPGLPEEAYRQAIDQATAHDHAKTLVAINQDKYELLRNGALVRFKDDAGRAVERRLRLVDFVDPDNNSFKAVRELWMRGRSYPIHAMYSAIRDAILEVQHNLKAPDALIAGSFLTAMSIASQGDVDVELPTGQLRPVSLDVLVIADSGERKSATDSIVGAPIYEHDEKVARDQGCRGWKVCTPVGYSPAPRLHRVCPGHSGCIRDTSRQVRRSLRPCRSAQSGHGFMAACVSAGGGPDNALHGGRSRNASPAGGVLLRGAWCCPALITHETRRPGCVRHYASRISPWKSASVP